MSLPPSHDSEENLPDWLKELRKRQQQEGETEPSQPAPEPPTGERTPPPEQGAEAEPDWLLDVRRRHQKESDTEPHRTLPRTPEDEVASDEAEGEEIAELNDTQPGPTDVADAAAPEAAFHEEAEASGSSDQQPPDWLQAMEENVEAGDQEEEDQGYGSIPAFPQDNIEPASPGELPTWLEALRPGAEPRQPPREQEENTGPLAGLRGALPAEPDVASIGRGPARSGRLEANEHQQRHAAVLERLIASEGQSISAEAETRILPIRILRYAIGVLLIAATALPLLLGGQTAPRPVQDAFPESGLLYRAIESLPANSPVLVIFEVEPSLYGELAAPAAAVLDHLLQKQVRLVFISTQPTGPALVGRLLITEFASEPSIATGDYLNLGYLSGGMAAMRQFSTNPRGALPEIARTGEDPWASQPLEDVRSLNDFGLVLVVASEAETGKAWIEQSAPSAGQGLFMVSSAQAAPVLLPYLQSHPATLKGLVAGVAGAAYYERQRADDGLGTRYWNAYSYAVGAALLLILIGGLYGRIIQTSPGQPAAREEGPDAV
jgi:hypothetical protein